MAENVYEGMYILDSGRYSRDPSGVSGQMEKFVKDLDGEILVSRLFDERRLAYQINGQRKGTYWLTYFRVDGSRLGELERACKLSDSIHRCMHVKLDPRIVDPIVEHVRAGHVILESGGKKETAAGPKGPADGKVTPDEDAAGEDAAGEDAAGEKASVDAPSEK